MPTIVESITEALNAALSGKEGVELLNVKRSRHRGGVTATVRLTRGCESTEMEVGLIGHPGRTAEDFAQLVAARCDAMLKSGGG